MDRNSVAEMERQLTWLTLIANLPSNTIADSSPELYKKFERKKADLFSALTTVERLEDLFEHNPDLTKDERKIILEQVIKVTTFYRHQVRSEIWASAAVQ